ncbi:type IV toxin-antitoxin system AbiEi family antitoxin domain-containing protein [Rahnella aquatilis]|uniref:type IV toxin-antitoxin system AbiEi family antitoxin domain-containing protein n=1 Tax=Rahnella aquatilis TaxID=34038 RepID=UPI000647112A|nr:type IV toxin-antitoxin system AbiEi family antitoxin domain-containing protein [Rahnella aquatilis]
MRKNINWLFLNTYPGQIMLQTWLTSQGIERSSSSKYVKEGLLKRLDTGVYCRAGKEPGWVDAVHCLQTQWNKPVHVAGLTSLNLQGGSHYLELSAARMWLNLPPRVYLPKWLQHVPGVKWYSAANNRLESADNAFLKEVTVSSLKITCSSAELAAYEVANNVPKLIEFTHANELFQGLISLNPKKLQLILSASDAVKTNRVFMFLAQRNQHKWFERLDVTRIKMGNGTRQIEAGGRLDTDYKITVPASLIRNIREDEQF